MRKLIFLFGFVGLFLWMNISAANASVVKIDPVRFERLAYLDGFDSYLHACQNRNYDEAKRILDDLIYYYPDEAYLYFLRSVILTELKDYSGARNDLAYYHQYDPEDIDGYKLNTYVCFEDKAYEDAMYYCQRGLELNPDNTYLLKYEQKLAELITTQRKKESFEHIGMGEGDYYMQEMLQFINDKRRNADLPELAMNAILNQAAKKRAGELITEFSHTRPDGTPFLSVMKEFDIPYHFAGEVAYKRAGTPDQVLAEWRETYTSKEFGIDPDTKYVGIGYVEEDGITYLVQIFMF